MTVPQMEPETTLRVLLAEDNAVNQTVAVKMLEKLGYSAEVVTTGSAAVAAVERERYDIVLMDMHMPEMDGLEATRRIRASTGDAGPRIIALTASVMEEDRQRCREAGMDLFLAKPLRSSDLKEAIARALEPEPPASARLENLSLQTQLEEFTAMFGEETALELLTLFLTDTPPRLSLLHEAVTSGDAEETRRVAHALKGGSATLGIVAMAESCKRLELEAKAGNLSNAPAYLDDIDEEFRGVKTFAAELETARNSA